ncbi:MAG: hypothetical protein FJ148_22910 [Deltaproteobacteria bacterium]|nr:hypothetical protein [Deltaproteobacteria bacterium]
MATVNFSVPDDVKAAFDRTFARTNKSAVIARLMRQAVEEEALARRRRSAARALLRLRADLPATSDKAIRAARRTGRA